MANMFRKIAAWTSFLAIIVNFFDKSAFVANFLWSLSIYSLSWWVVLFAVITVLSLFLAVVITALDN